MLNNTNSTPNTNTGIEARRMKLMADEGWYNTELLRKSEGRKVS